MNRIMRIIRIGLHILIKCNLIKTLYLNFKMLPFKQAIKLPIWIYGKIVFRSLSGQIIIEASNITSGMVKIGKKSNYVNTCIPQTILTVNGILKFKGNINFLQGNYVLVSKNGYLEFGKTGSMVGSNCKIICFDRIIVGDNVRMTWECQIIDTSFHYVEQIETKKVSSLTKPIIISDNCWIGNRTTISKGTILPSYSIVTSNSLVNKDYTEYGSNCMFAGCPARFKMKCKKIYDIEQEKEYDRKFCYDRTHL